MTATNHGAKDNREHLLDHYALAAPLDELRHRVLCSRGKEPRPPVSESLLRCALVALVLTMTWASWQERQTAERMARLARASLARYVDAGEMVEIPNEELSGGRLMTALLCPRLKMPIPPGYPSTRIQLWRSSLSQKGIGRRF